MIAFIVRRLFGAVALLLIVTAVAFAIFFLVPKLAGQTTDQLAATYVGKSPSQEAIDDVKEKLHLDDPIVVQYGRFVAGIVTGQTYDTGTSVEECPAPCLGYSFRNQQPVLGSILDKVPVTMTLAAGAALIWVLAGVATGVLSALRRGSLFDRLAMGTALTGVSLPVYFTGALCLTFIVHQWGLLPSVVWENINGPVSLVQIMILPWITLAFLYAAMYARLTRAGMLETMNEDYIRTARAKGLPERTVITKHALRATLTPVLTIFGLDIGLLLGGAVLTETTFSLDGVGRFAIYAIASSDLPVVLGVTMFAAFFVVMANLVVDILYAVVDPRVRYS